MKSFIAAIGPVPPNIGEPLPFDSQKIDGLNPV